MKTVLKYSLPLLLLLLSVACTEDDSCRQGTGEIITRELPINDFSKIRLYLSMQVTVSQGEEVKVIAKGQRDIIDALQLETANAVMNIGFEGHCYQDYELELFITLPELKAIEVFGPGNVQVKDFTRMDHLSLSINGSGEIGFRKLQDLTDLNTEIIGSGTITSHTANTIENLQISVNGSGEYHGFLTRALLCDAEIISSVEMEVSVENQLHVAIEGTGHVYYKGRPEITSHIQGSGKIISNN